MMFLFHTAFATGLIALAAGTFLLLWAKRDTACQICVKSIAYFIIATSALGLACTTYYTIRYSQDGYFNAPFIVDFTGMSHGMGKGRQCCDKDKAAGMMMGDDADDAHGKECPMKKGMMMPSEEMDMDEMKEGAPAPSGHEHP